MFTHGRDLKSGSQIHAFVILLLLVRTAEEAGDGPGLLGLLVAVHEPHCLPVEVILALHREQCVDPPCLFLFFLSPTATANQTQNHHQQLTQKSRHYRKRNWSEISTGFCSRDLNFMIWCRWRSKPELFDFLFSFFSLYFVLCQRGDAKGMIKKSFLYWFVNSSQIFVVYISEIELPMEIASSLNFSMRLTLTRSSSILI